MNRSFEPKTRRRVIRLKELLDRIGLSRSGVYARLDKHGRYYDPSFPRQIQLGVQSVAWFEDEVEEWLAGRARSLPDEASRGEMQS